MIATRQINGTTEIAFEVPVGYSTNDLRQETDAIAASLGQMVEIRNHMGAAVVVIHKADFPNSIPADFRTLAELADQKRKVLIGFDRRMVPIYHDFRVPHLLIAGMSGYGKTDLIRWILFQLIAKHTPDELTIEIIDMKGFSFLPFRGIPHIPNEIARDLPSALAVLQRASNLLKKRSNKVWQANERSTVKRFKWHIVLIDEAAQIAAGQMRDKQSKKIAGLCDQLAGEISCVGREASVGLIYCTQRPDMNTINPQVKANMEASIGFRTKTQSNSEIIIDRPGLEALPFRRPGRIIYAGSEDVHGLVPYVGNDERWNRWLAPYKKQEVKAHVETSDYDGTLE